MLRLGPAGRMKVLLVVEDEPDLQLLVQLQFSLDPDFEVDGQAADIATAIALARVWQPDLIVLDHKLEGTTTGLEGAPALKQAAPNVRIILFSASEEMRVPAAAEPAIDAFLMKTDVRQLVPLSRKLLELA